jgi:flagellin
MTSILNSVAVLGSSRQLGVPNKGLKKTLERLTSGASDAAANLTIDNKLSADVRLAAQGRRNANDGISILQTADDVLGEVTNLLTRAGELAQQASSSTSGPDGGPGKTALDAEFQNIVKNLGDKEANTQFNSAKIFGGSALSMAMGGDTNVAVTVGTFNSLTSADTLTTAAAAAATADKIAAALAAVATLRDTLGANQQQLQTVSNSLGIQVENFTAANSPIRDANMADEVVNLSKFQILNQSGVSALGQANTSSQAILALLR